MSLQQGLERATRLVNARQYVCRACYIQATRQFHTSRALLAEKPWTQRLRESIFGSKESREAEQLHQEKNEKRIERVQERVERRTESRALSDKRSRRFQVAESIHPTTHSDYVQSSTWDGLERIGGEKWVKQQADRGEPYIGFAARKRRTLSDSQWQLLLHHIAVEVLVLQTSGRNVNQICFPRSSNPDNFLRTRNAKIVKEGPGAKVEDAQVQEILEAIPHEQTGQQPDEETLSQELAGAVAQGTLPQYPEEQLPWMEIDIRDPSVKLTIMKRALQLTGTRIPDFGISNASTLLDLYNICKHPVKPKKLARTPELQELVKNGPSNLKVHPSRQSPIHKEKAIGRWKIIEEELVRRDLPVTGTRWSGAKSYIP